MATDPTRRTPTDDEMPALLEALAAAGGNTAAFARDRGLTAWKLYQAQRVAAGGDPRRRRRRHGPDRDFVPVHVVEEPSAPSPPFELVLGSGHRLLIPREFDETSLLRLMGVLASC